MIFIFKRIFVHCLLKFDIILCNLSNGFLEARFIKPGGQSSPYRWFKFSNFCFEIFLEKLRFFCNFISIIMTQLTKVGDYQRSYFRLLELMTKKRVRHTRIHLVTKCTMWPTYNLNHPLLSFWVAIVFIHCFAEDTIQLFILTLELFCFSGSSLSTFHQNTFHPIFIPYFTPYFTSKI